jgi:nucleotide-binding universal stress UspA family protein
MNKKLLTIAVLPVVKARDLKNLLENKNIKCVLEELFLPEGTSSLSVRVQIMEENLEKALPVLEEFIGNPVGSTVGANEKDRQILVPVDFSTFSLKAAKVAFEIAKLLKYRMVLFHSYPNPIVYSVPFSDIYAFDTGLMAHLENAEITARQNMEAFLKNLIGFFTKETWSQVETEYILKTGDARDDILLYSNQNPVLLIVMGTQGKAESEYDIIGSVTAEIISSTKIPVLAIPGETPENISGNFHKIMYATNFDEKDFFAIEKLMNIISPYPAEIHCVHVGRQEEPVWSLARLEGMKNILRSKYHDKIFECHLITGEDILYELDKFISENNINVLALTTHKRSMITRIFNPSIARRMLFHTRIPLLVFHA